MLTISDKVGSLIKKKAKNEAGRMGMRAKMETSAEENFTLPPSGTLCGESSRNISLPYLGGGY